jgi:hypothetical protein
MRLKEFFHDLEKREIALVIVTGLRSRMFAMGCNTIGDLGILGEIFRCLACAYDGRCPAYRGRTRGNYLLTQILSGIFQGILAAS